MPDPLPPTKDPSSPLKKLLIGEWEWKTGEDTVRMAFDKDGSLTITGPTNYLDEATNEYKKIDIRLHGTYEFSSADVVDLEIMGLSKHEGVGTVGASKNWFPVKPLGAYQYEVRRGHEADSASAADEAIVHSGLPGGVSDCPIRRKKGPRASNCCQARASGKVSSMKVSLALLAVARDTGTPCGTVTK